MAPGAASKAASRPFDSGRRCQACSLTTERGCRPAARTTGFQPVDVGATPIIRSSLPPRDEDLALRTRAGWLDSNREHHCGCRPVGRTRRCQRRDAGSSPVIRSIRCVGGEATQTPAKRLHAGSNPARNSHGPEVAMGRHQPCKLALAGSRPGPPFRPRRGIADAGLRSRLRRLDSARGHHPPVAQQMTRSVSTREHAGANPARRSRSRRKASAGTKNIPAGE